MIVTKGDYEDKGLRPFTSRIFNLSLSFNNFEEKENEII